MMFYTFRQNNSYGYFQIDDDICEYVIVEAENSDEANEKAETLNIYFDGVGDCPCCGSRWWRVDAADSTERPEIYGEDAIGEAVFKDVCNAYKRIYIYYADGRVIKRKGPKVED
jgi:hypothetical protein